MSEHEGSEGGCEGLSVGPECSNCGKTTCPDADLPEFTDPRECEFASMYEAFRATKDCDYGCGRDYSMQAVRLWMVPEMERLLADRLAPVQALARSRSVALGEAILTMEAWHDRAESAESARDTALREKADVEARLAAVEALADYLTRKVGPAKIAIGTRVTVRSFKGATGTVVGPDGYPKGSALAVRMDAPYPDGFRDGYACVAVDEVTVVSAALANPSAAQREAEVGARATVTFPAHHLVGMDLGMTCINCGNHTELSAPCIPARDYPLTTDEAEVPR